MGKIWGFFACISMVSLMLISCEEDDPILLETAPPFVVNKCENEGNSILFYKANTGNNALRAININVRITGDTLSISFSAEPGFYINNLKFHLATDPDEIPQGEEAYREYAYEVTSAKFLISKFTNMDEFRGYLYMTAFANVGRFDVLPTQEIETEVLRAHSLESQSYFIQTLRNMSENDSEELIGEFPAFCLQGDQRMNTGFRHNVRRLSSYTIDKAKLAGVVDNEKNIPLVNWILNQDRSRWMRSDGQPANGSDIQRAIWKLVETTGNPSGLEIQGLVDENVVSKIVIDAQSEGRGFKPGCFQNELVILHKGIIPGINPTDSSYNSGPYANPNYQVSGIVQRVECEEIQKSFSIGTRFTGSTSEDEAQYFAICIN